MEHQEEGADRVKRSGKEDGYAGLAVQAYRMLRHSMKNGRKKQISPNGNVETKTRSLDASTAMEVQTGARQPSPPRTTTTAHGRPPRPPTSSEQPQNGQPQRQSSPKRWQWYSSRELFSAVDDEFVGRAELLLEWADKRLDDVIDFHDTLGKKRPLTFNLKAGRLEIFHI